ncbi:nagb/rpia/CoA transferase-like protein [Coccomyxa subellipsoidea C-169]|uniref:Nagb/rpia/CoA transferase-like protein n=1 Tax=Coccomyxa subellipsoidea (strain C-169) TaxID=574566 RepID=I0Z291_COCSC|nr:nagb/rpia/CoA transferase-like protein [Coccomyxa subellipsoidea C-169]EIE24760.1 nagb/rpia/CoA transferase-like protein [Coccomyxa subellipsoidea C-169]|eukprot:XP_005649304.1 nagb/rpia/CoA transferase-like protein [Coccomyxa subellipsoidea C-169]
MGCFFADKSLEAIYEASLARRSAGLSVWVNNIMAIAWISCIPKLLFYSITPRRAVIILIWLNMAIYHCLCASALKKETRLLRHETMKISCVIANAVAGMVCILLLKRDEIGQAVHLFDHITDMDPENIHIPDGSISESEVLRTSRDSRTHMVYLDRVTRLDAASDFFGEQHVPRRALTMGISTILNARRILLMAFGENKADIAARAVEGPVTSKVPASFLQEHPNATVFLDIASSSGLTQTQKPWVLGSVCWNELLVHVAYQTSGCIAVHDHDALRHLDFVERLASTTGPGAAQARKTHAEIKSFVAKKKSGEVDTPRLQQVKTLIRYTEATSAAGVCGVPGERAHFLDMPFYETGTVAKKELCDEDIRLIVELFQRVHPQQIYAAGDLSDPHGTHRTCLKAVLQAVDEVKAQAWFQGTEVFLYRGAWQVEAIFRHESQKDRALFPGADDREFWQRAKDRNKATAGLYNKLGLPEYEAMEAFVRYDPFKPSHLFRKAAKACHAHAGNQAC